MEEENVNSLLKKLRTENKNFKKDAAAARRDFESAAKGHLGTLLFSRWASEVERLFSQFERAMLACDMAMIVSTVATVATKTPYLSTLEKVTARPNAQETFRRAAKLQKEILPFAEIHSAYFEAGDFLDAQQIADFLKSMEGLWPLLSQAESLYIGCIEWRHDWTEKMNFCYEKEKSS